MLLVEKYGFRGGAATRLNVLAYCGFFQQGPEPIKVVGGVADIPLGCLRAPGQGANTPLKNAAIASGASSGVTAATY